MHRRPRHAWFSHGGVDVIGSEENFAPTLVVLELSGEKDGLRPQELAPPASRSHFCDRRLAN